MKFTSTYFKEEFQTRGSQLTLATPEHEKMNGQVKVTWRMLRTIAQSLMVHMIVLEVYIHFALMYTTYHIYLVLPIKDMIHEYGNPNRAFKLATVTKPSVSHIREFFCTCVVHELFQPRMGQFT